MREFVHSFLSASILLTFLQRRPTNELLGNQGDDGNSIWLTRRCGDGSYTVWLSKHYCVRTYRTFMKVPN
jgi:hypothetical protein